MLQLNLLEETRYEKIPVTVYESQSSAAVTIANRIASLIRDKQKNKIPAVLGLATGASPLSLYAELVRLHKDEGLSFKNVITFNLDEYYPMKQNSPHSYVEFMYKNLFSLIDIDPDNIHIPDGTLGIDAITSFCLEYEQKINRLGGLDLQILGIGRTGHVGFNEPGSAPNSGTRLVSLDDLTRKDAAHEFGSKENVPTKAISMGIGTIFKAKEIVLLAWGEKKADIVRQAVEGDLSSAIPATFLQLAENVEFIIDKDAAIELTRFNTPWLVKDCVWTDTLIKKAVTWLAKKVQKPILKLTEEDYNNNGMAALATEKGPVYNININIFNQIQQTITGWPGGKPNADDSQRPERRFPEKKRSLIFSPHPDDDVISMGGTFIRLSDQGHDVHVAYQTSGNTAVWNDDALRFLEFSIDFNKAISKDSDQLAEIYKEIRNDLENGKSCDRYEKELLIIKGLIRKGEAIAGARFAGLKDDHIHFMDLPFYDRSKVMKDAVQDDDVAFTMNLLNRIKPHQIFAAGDFADPHGTHKVCFDIIRKAMQVLRKTEDWTKDCWLWMYRGAWHEFEISEIEMAVPLSPIEVERKRLAIFKHQSQKDTPVFPGDDAREFWVRAEHRTRETASLYNSLGFAEYEAIEAFVQYKFD
ncbi:glucosamine-6-phosphate deaminase [Mucilaginibacter sp. X5P1]|uniref:glucosamine-6-phosphate deaminase n=1 Tax=Mucilaginibacter sp. X5P1 TaxID=2723088 RepID=UPI00160D8C67|nr:glucosamine-6-phosphate deaminase [Mucilaginibacter sp. X5P1]